MVNINFNPNLLLGLIAGFGVLVLYFLRYIKPELARDEDIFFATIGLLYCCILIVHGWRLDPILLFSQVLIILTTLVAGWENIRLRGLVNYLISSGLDSDSDSSSSSSSSSSLILASSSDLSSDSNQDKKP
jgi:hypothetical protein